MKLLPLPALLVAALSPALPLSAAEAPAASPSPAASPLHEGDRAAYDALCRFLGRELGAEEGIFYGVVSACKGGTLTVAKHPASLKRRRETKAVLCTLAAPPAEGELRGQLVLVRYRRADIAPAGPAAAPDSLMKLEGVAEGNVLLLPPGGVRMLSLVMHAQPELCRQLDSANHVMPQLAADEAAERGAAMYREEIRLYREAHAVLAGNAAPGDKAAQLEPLRQQARGLDCVDSRNAPLDVTQRLYEEWKGEWTEAREAFDRVASSYANTEPARDSAGEAGRLHHAVRRFIAAMVIGD